MAVRNSTSKTGIIVNPVGAVLAGIHFLCAVLMYAQHYEGSWGYVPFVFLDLPVEVILLMLNRLFGLTTGWLPTIVFGTMWWYLVGVWLSRVFGQHKSETDSD